MSNDFHYFPHFVQCQFVLLIIFQLCLCEDKTIIKIKKFKNKIKKDKIKTPYCTILFFN